MVKFGAAGRLLVSREIKDVLPLEDDEPLDAANPVTADGQVRLDVLKVQTRQDAIVTNLLKGGSFGLMILGAIMTCRRTCGDSIEANNLNKSHVKQVVFVLRHSC